MTRSVLTSVLCLFLVTVYLTAGLLCGPNEWEGCRSDCLDKCPTSSQTVCTTPSSCEVGCKCGFNFRRAANGTCIPTSTCPPFECGVNERYEACPDFCPIDDCSNATPDGSCPLPFNIINLVVVECQPACKCIDGYWKKNGVCVPYAECRKD